MKYTIFTILLCVSTFSMAKNKTQYIPSTVLPTNVSAEQYQLLLDEYKTKAAEAAKDKAKADAQARARARAKRIASSAKKDFENKIHHAWNTPANSTGKKATARVTLNDSGNIVSLVVSSSDPDMKTSIKTAIRSAAPYPMPSDPDARREALTFTSTFTSK